MASVTSYTADKIDAELDLTVVGGSAAGGELVLTTRGGSDISLGDVVDAVPTATDTISGVVELATDVETQTGTDANRVVTPFGLASVVASATARGLVELATTAEVTTGTDTVRAVTPAGAKAVYQPLDSDLTAIAAIAPANDDVVQRKAGAWTNRTMAQLATDLMATGEFPDVRLYNGSAYVDSDGANIYVGTADPGSVTNGSVWYDTTGG